MQVGKTLKHQMDAYFSCVVTKFEDSERGVTADIAVAIDPAKLEE